MKKDKEAEAYRKGLTTGLIQGAKMLGSTLAKIQEALDTKEVQTDTARLILIRQIITLTLNSNIDV